MIYNSASSKEFDISSHIINKLLNTKTFLFLCSKFEIDPNRVKSLKFEISDLKDNYAETDGSKMILNKIMLKDGMEVFFKKYFFIIMHEIVHFLSRSKERDGYFNDPEEVLGFVAAIAYELENGSGLDDIWNKIYPKVSWHFKNEQDAKVFFENMLLKAKEFGSINKEANIANIPQNTLYWGANQIGEFYNRARSVAHGGIGAAANQFGQAISDSIQTRQQKAIQDKAYRTNQNDANETRNIDLVIHYVHDGRYNLATGIKELNNIASYSSNRQRINYSICDRINVFLGKYPSPNVISLSKSMNCSGPGQAKCIICGKFVQGTDRFCDIYNALKMGQNAVFCTIHANEFGIITRC